MKKVKNSAKVITVCLCGMLFIGAIGCGSKNYENASSSAMDYDYKGSFTTDQMYAEEVGEYQYTDSSNGLASTMPSYNSSNNIGGTLTEEELLEVFSEDNRKTIKTATLNLETLEYDKFLTALEQQVNAVGAYMEYAYEYGNGYYSSSRSAEYRIRVPQSNLTSFLDGLSNIATVVSKNQQEQDVTLEYVDTESRIKTLQVEQERLLALLEQADSLDSIIALEQRLSEVRYEIESYTSQLRTYDNKITYSTVSLYVSEVLRVTPQEPKTVWERIATGWDNTVYNITTGAQDWFVWLIVSAPYLVFWILVITVAVVLIRKKVRTGKQKKQQAQAKTEEVKKEHDTEMDNKK